MNKLFTVALAAAFAFPLFAQEAASEEAKPVQAAGKEESAMWPAFFAVYEWPASPDLIGLRLTIPCSTEQDSVTGVDLGFWGRSMYFEGIQVNLLRNDVKDSCAGFQIGLYNSSGRADLFGIQVGLWNETGSIRGIQAGLVNLAGDIDGFQVGVINRCESMYGVQVGLINVIREAEIQFLPVVNIGF